MHPLLEVHPPGPLESAQPFFQVRDVGEGIDGMPANEDGVSVDVVAGFAESLHLIGQRAGVDLLRDRRQGSPEDPEPDDGQELPEHADQAIEALHSHVEPNRVCPGPAVASMRDGHFIHRFIHRL